MYIGSLTKNAPIISKVNFCLNGAVIDGITILRVLFEFMIIRRVINRGIEAVNVYISMYIVAVTRSGCGPQYIINAAVGIRVVSNAI